MKSALFVAVFLTLAASQSAGACDVNYIEGAIVDWSGGCGADDSVMRDIAEHDQAPGFTYEVDRPSFERYYSGIKKVTKIGDSARDGRTPQQYCDAGMHYILLDGSSDNWMYKILSGEGNSEKEIKYLSKKAHDEFFGRVTTLKCRMNGTAKQSELKLEGKTLVLEVSPQKCDDSSGCKYSTSRPKSTEDNDFHPYNIYQWMVPFFSKNFPAFKEARDVSHKRYPQTAL